MKKYLIENIKININDLLRTKDREAVIRRLHLDEQKVKDFRVIRKSIDARKRNSEGIFYVYSVVISYPFRPKVKGGRVSVYIETNKELSLPKRQYADEPVIVGSGPAGLFSALYLAKMGYRPVVFEQGEEIRKRVEKVNRFFSEGILDENTNVQFGLGGAGAFSDGKINSRIKDPLKYEVLKTFVDCGAPKFIMYDNKPHLGTDRLRVLVDDIKTLIEYYGGSFRFSSKVTDIIIEDERVRGIVVNGSEEIECETVILAIGNSSRDTFRILKDKGVRMEAKPFAVGFRVEHLREDVDRFCYGRFAGHPTLGAASYNLTFNDKVTGKGVYSFCNCPGGVVIPGASESGRLTTNGMSFHKRNMVNSNAAIVANVNAEDYGNDILSGLEFQERIEEKTFTLGEGGYKAPYMAISDFLGRDTECNTKPSYRPQSEYRNLNGIYSEKITASVKNALDHFCTFFDGFDRGVIIGSETRTSSPVRIVRDRNTMESINISGLYPVGEGAGYAGGILSSAVDGIKAALAVNE